MKTIFLQQNTLRQALLFIGLGVLLSLAVPQAVLAAFPADYSQYQEVTIDSTKVDADLTDFPIYIDLSDLDVVDADLWDTTTDCGDIRVSKSDGTTELAREIVSCSTASSTGEMHVKYTGTLSSTTDTVIRVWYNGTDGEPAATSTYGRNAVWSDYLVVQHLDAYDDLTDSTGNENDLVSAGSPTTDTGKLGGGVSLGTPTEGYSISPSPRADSTSFTTSLWFSAPDNGGASKWLLDDGLSTSGGFHGLIRGAGEFRVRVDDSGSNGGVYDTTTLVDDGTLRLLHISADLSSIAQTYVNGAQNGATLDISGYNNIGPTATALFIGGDHYGFSGTPATIDEFRIRETVLSSDWISTEYNNQSAVSTFYAVGAEQNATIATSYSQYQEVTIDSTKVDADLTDFPIYIDLADLAVTGTDLWDVTTDCGDIRVTKDNGTTELAREIVSCSTASSTGEMHVKYTGTLSSTTDTVIRVWYNGTNSEPSATSTYGSKNVWTNYVGTWRLQEDPSGTAPQMLDSTANGNDGTSAGTMTTADSVAAQLGKGIDIDGSDDYIDMGNIGITALPVTISTWVKLDTIDSTGKQLVVVTDSVGSAYYSGVNLGVNSENFRAQVGDDTGKTSFDRKTWTGTTAPSTGTWYYVAVSIDTIDDLNLYVNGAAESTTISGTASGVSFPGGYPARIGRWTLSDLPDRYIDGQVDDVRISNSILSAEWISTEYKNQSAASTFYAVGAGQGGGSGDSVTVSGTLYSDEGSTAITGGEVIKLVIGTTTPVTATTTSDGSGVYSFSASSIEITTDTPIIVFVDNDESVRAAVVTKATASTSDITNLNLYQDRVIVRHEGSTSTSLTDLAVYDSTDDADLQYTASSTLDSLSVLNGQELHIWSGDTFVMAASSTLAGDFHNEGVFDSNGGTIYFTGTDPQVSGTFTGSSALGDVVVNPVGGGTAWTAQSAAGDNDTWYDVAYGDGLFVAVSFSSTDSVMTSPDGITWTARSAGSGDGERWHDITYGNGLFVAVGEGYTHRVMTSPDGITWTTRTAPSANWEGVTYGDGLFVAVSRSNDRVMTSPDGITWTARSAAGDDDGWQSVTYGNGLFVAVGTGLDRVMTSPDGTTWTARSAAGDNDSWIGVTYGNGLFVAVSVSGDRVMTSPDGITWTTRSAAGDDDSWIDIFYGNSRFVAVGNSGDNRLMTSPDGITWTTHSAAGDNDSWYGVTYGNGVFVAVSNSGDRVMTSNGVLTLTTASTTNLTVQASKTLVSTTSLTVAGDFTQNGVLDFSGNDLFITGGESTLSGTFAGDSALNNLTINTTLGFVARTAAGDDDTWRSVAYGNGSFVAVGSGSDLVMTSPDGITWTTRSAAVEGDSWYGVTYGNGLFVAVRASGVNNGVMTSPDGITWTARSAAGDDDSWSSVTYGDGLFVAVGYSGDRVMTSPDGITWTTRTAAGDDDSWQSVTYGNGLFVAVGNSGNLVMTSPDGITWTARSAAGDDDNWRSVTYGDGLFVAVSQTGDRVMTSPDGITWTARSAAGDDDGWYGVTYGNGLFLAVSVSGVDRVMTSPDGITWTARSAAGDDDSWLGVTYGNSRFVGVGASGDRVMTGSVVATLADTASTTNLTIETDSTFVAPTTSLTIAGSYQNNGTFDHNNGTLYLSGASKTLSGTLADTSELGNVVVAGSYTASNNASTTDLTISSGGSFTAPSLLTINGDFTQNGTFNNNSGTTYFTGLDPVVAGSLTGTSALGDVVVGLSGGVESWTTRTAAADDDSWYDVTYGNGLFVAVGATGDRVMTSPDGITWTARSAAGDDDSWIGITYANHLFVAVAYSGTDRVMTSPDGITWTARSAAGDNDGWFTITYGNGLFVALSYSGDRLMTSPDGITWTARSVVGDDDSWRSVTYGNGLFVAVAFSGTDRVMTSPDGITWTARSAAGDNDGWIDVTYGNGLFVAVGATGDLVMTSPDGITWTARSAAGDDDDWYDVTYANGLFVAVGPLGDNRVMTSPDGITWTTRSAAGDNDDWNSVTHGNDLFVAVSNSGDNRVMTAGTPAVTLANNASTTDLTINNGGRFAAPNLLTISGGYVNGGTFTASTSEVVFNGTSQQTATGAMTDDSSLYDLTISNTSGTGATQSVIFGMPVTTTGTFTMVASTSAQFLAGATSTFQNVDWQGGSASEVWLRSSTEGNQWYLDIPGSQLNVSYVNVQDSNASSSSGGEVVATNSTDSGNNSNWDLSVPVTTGTSTISDHDATQVSNAFDFQNKTNEALFAFKLIPDTGNATVTNLVISLSGAENISVDRFSNIRLYRDYDNDATYDATDAVVGGAGAMSLSGQTGSITFSEDFLATTSQNFVLIADWNAPENGAFLALDLLPSGVTAVDSVGAQNVSGSVNNIQHNRNNKVGGGSSATIGGTPPAGREIVTGGTNEGGELIGDDANYRWPSSHDGSWSNGGYAYDQVDGTYATTDIFNATSSFSDHGFAVPGSNQITGIVIKLEISGTVPVGNVDVELSYDGGTSWTASKSSPTLTTTDAVVSLGGSSDTWGREWSAGEFSNTNFVVRLTGKSGDSAVQVDALQVRVYHQATGGGSGGGGAI